MARARWPSLVTWVDAEEADDNCLPRRSHPGCAGGVGILACVFLSSIGDVVLHPLKHTTMPTYRLASTQWWQGIDPYSTRCACRNFSIFRRRRCFLRRSMCCRFMAGEILWRACDVRTFRLCAGAVERFFSLREWPARENISASVAAGRAELLGEPAQRAVRLAAGRADRADRGGNRDRAVDGGSRVDLSGVALKPLAVVPLLLFGALYWKLIPRVAVGLLIVLALPFLHWNPAFVAHEYVRCFQTLVGRQGERAALQRPGRAVSQCRL